MLNTITVNNMVVSVSTNSNRVFVRFTENDNIHTLFNTFTNSREAEDFAISATQLLIKDFHEFLDFIDEFDYEDSDSDFFLKLYSIPSEEPEIDYSFGNAIDRAYDEYKYELGNL